MRRWVLAAVIGGAARAAAAGPVEVLARDLPADLAAERVAAALDLEPGAVRASPAADWLSARPPRLDAGTLLPCDGPRTTEEELEVAIDAAVRASALDPRVAAERFLAAEARLPCVVGPLRPDTVGRLYAAGAGRVDEAVAPAWREAASRLADGSAGAGATLRVEPPVASIDVDASARDATAPLALAPGRHLLRVPGELGALVDLPPGDVSLWRPAALPASALSTATEEERRAAAQALAWALPEGAEVAIVDPDAVWWHLVGSSRWEERWSPALAELEARRRGPRKLIAAGLGAAALGLIVTAIAHPVTSNAVDAAREAPDEASREAAGRRYRRAVAALATGEVVLTAGAATAGLGVVLSRDGRTRRLAAAAREPAAPAPSDERSP